MHRQMTDYGVQLIQISEKFVPTRYICPAGYWTIGYGHLIRKGEKWDSPTAVITEEGATELLNKDNDEAEKAVLRLIRVPLEDWQFDALCDFTFNVGSGALQASTLRSCLNRYEYYDAAMQFKRWVYGGGRILPGLVKRRQKEESLFLFGYWV